MTAGTLAAATPIFVEALAAAANASPEDAEEHFAAMVNDVEHNPDFQLSDFLTEYGQ